MRLRYPLAAPMALLFLAAAVLHAVLLPTANAYYLPGRWRSLIPSFPHASPPSLTPLSLSQHHTGTYPVEYRKGSSITVEVNSLVSSDTEIPFDYYSMPFCKPKEGVKKSSGSINPGTIMLGMRIENSPYVLRMMEEEYAKSACRGKEYATGAYPALSKTEAKELKEKIREEYRVRMILDNLPITTYDLEMQPDSVRPGFEVGSYDKDSNKYYVNNHLMFKVLVHESNGQYARLRQRDFIDLEGVRRRLLADDADGGDGDEDGASYMVVGFEVVACSIRRDPSQKAKYEGVTCGDEGIKPQEVKEGAEIAYTYDVYWETSDITWASRWDAYMKMPGGRVHWFSIMNSLMVVVVMSCIVAMIMMRTIRRDLQKYEQLLVDGNPQTDMADESGWKMVSGDVFRAPAGSHSLAMHIGSGVQILASGTVTLVFATFGFLSPASRGSLLTAALILYLLMSVVAGYAAVWMWGAINRSQDGWQTVCWRTACFFPGVTVTVMSLMNLILHATGSSGSIPLGFFFSVLFLWLIISIPLAFVGGALASRREVRPFPTRTNQIPRYVDDAVDDDDDDDVARDVDLSVLAIDPAPLARSPNSSRTLEKLSQAHSRPPLGLPSGCPAARRGIAAFWDHFRGAVLCDDIHLAGVLLLHVRLFVPRVVPDHRHHHRGIDRLYVRPAVRRGLPVVVAIIPAWRGHIPVRLPLLARLFVQHPAPPFRGPPGHHLPRILAADGLVSEFGDGNSRIPRVVHIHRQDL